MLDLVLAVRVRLRVHDERAERERLRVGGRVVLHLPLLRRAALPCRLAVWLAILLCSALLCSPLLAALAETAVCSHRQTPPASALRFSGAAAKMLPTHS